MENRSSRPNTTGGALRLDSRTIHEGKVFSVEAVEVMEPGEIRSMREVVRHRGSAAVLPIHDDGRLSLIRQYRFPVDDRVWELPAGRIEQGETPAQSAAREMEEEIGLRAESIEPLVVYFSTPGFCDETMHVFRATRLSRVPPRPEVDEKIEARVFSLDEARAMIARGEIRDGKTLIALLLESERQRRSS
ncbi:MAG: NUDIX hydrolase [Vicinamibacteria bacterium]|nr:NUDIX hydrolase [Vicinamibacteria bacterium]